jgi:hypothetical protein
MTRPNDRCRMVDIPLSPDAKITVERRDQTVLVGINRPQMFNRIDPDAFYGLANAYYDFDNDSSLRAAVLFGHGENFSRGNDVEAFSALAKTGKAFTPGEGIGTRRRPTGIKAMLKVAHIGVNESADAVAFAKLEAEYVSPFKSEDFIEERKAEAENRPPLFHGR